MRAENHSVAVGHADQVSYFTGRRAPAGYPLQVGVVPNAAHRFQHRPLPDAPAGYRVLLGTAGVGKTQLAAYEARTAWQQGRLDLLVWAAAGSRAAILAAYARTMAELNGTEPGDAELGAREFLAWLRPGGAGQTVRWMIVLDGLADPEDLRGLWPPDDPHGRTVITSWRRDVAREGSDRHVVTVPVFSPAEAHDYLTAVLNTADRAESPGQLSVLAEELGRLPLALAQAARYLTGTGLSCAEYLDRLRDGEHRLADLVPAPGRLPDGQGEPLPHIWDQALRQVDPAARRLLELLAPLDPAGVPRPVVDRLTGQALRQPGEEAKETGSDRLLDLLHRCCLVEHDPSNEQRRVRVHPLVQRAAHESVPAHRSDESIDLAVEALLAGTVVNPERGWEPRYDAFYGQALRAEEVESLLSGVRRANPPSPPEVSAATLHGNLGALLRGPYRRRLGYRENKLAVRMGETLVAEGRPEQAVAYLRSFLAGVSEEAGADHPGTGEVRAALAEACAAAGDLAGAIAEYRGVIDVQVRESAAVPPGLYGILWPASAERVTKLRRRLAHWLAQNGDLVEVAAVFRDLVDDEQHGQDHRQVDVFDEYALRAEAADWLGRSGDPAGAALAYRQIVEASSGRFGRRFAAFFDLRYGYGHWLGESGDPRKAVKVLAGLLRDQLHVLHGRPEEDPYGRYLRTPDHRPVTFKTRAALAFWLGRSGDVRAAVAALEELLDEQLRHLGPDHPDIAATRQNLTHWRQQQQKRRWRRY
ncbi:MULTISPECIES: tetratricopeptide repeat protein [Streptomycetaceae]|uniref:tetratricopeptide repeat protein n=1 Tax=Streptomycetaceae TaxID=2062 RepID=UPI00093A8421|nr:tetratricopeptide repeat protein [Streptomyces sp. CB02056]OKI06936.1 hypothetical protein AMK13_16195 [Streptomyces sp. CB02056]